jgi:8-oxo-dGTP diphosphatase
MLRKRASAILLKEDKILLIRRKNERGEYYVFPGGGIQDDETPAQAVVREMMEEAGITVSSGDVIFHEQNEYDDNTLVSCEQIGDEEIVWQEDFKQTPTDSFVFEWVETERLPKLELLPKNGRDAVIVWTKKETL